VRAYTSANTTAWVNAVTLRLAPGGRLTRIPGDKRKARTAIKRNITKFILIPNYFFPGVTDVFSIDFLLWV
jgi:hypothetical protein